MAFKRKPKNGGKAKPGQPNSRKKTGLKKLNTKKAKERALKMGSTLKERSKNATPKKVVLYRSANRAKHNEEVLSRTSALKYPMAFVFAIFAIALVFMKINLLTGLNNAELLRYEQVQNFTDIIKNPIEPIHGLLQWITLIGLPDNQIVGMRAPGALMILIALFSLTLTFYYKSGNRYLPYTFFLIGASSPALVWFAHQGYIGLIDWTMLISVAYCCHTLLKNAALNYKVKTYLYTTYLICACLMLLEPFGLVVAPIFVALTLLKTEGDEKLGGNITSAKDRILQMGLKAKLLMGTVALSSIVLVGAMLAQNLGSWRVLTGFNSIRDIISNYSYVPAQLAQNTLGMLGIKYSNNTEFLGSGADYVLIVSLAIVLYGLTVKLIKKLRKKSIDSNTSLHQTVQTRTILLLAVFTLLSLIEPIGLATLPMYLCAIALVSLFIARMVSVVDAIFPVNPYPKIIAKTLVIILVLTVTAGNVVNVANNMGRANSAKDENLRLDASPFNLRIEQ